VSHGRKFLKNIARSIIIVGLCGLQSVNAGDPPSDETLDLHWPCGIARFDAAGFADVIKWSASDYHPHEDHELLSGEWAAAIYYDGIETDTASMWLTDKLLYPDWETDNDFEYDSAPQDWNDPNNPVVSAYETNRNDTGQSVIANGEVEITIDYEMVDLGEGQFSPLAYREPGQSPRIRRSERYVLLQTYTIKNIKAAGNITGLEFYQMLHSHGADDYGPVVHSSYEVLDFPDALENYTPWNDVHEVGNFKYDITQWNNPDDPQSDPMMSPLDPHIDWIGFSCTLEPNVIDCNMYGGHSPGKPAQHTVHIDRSR